MIDAEPIMSVLLNYQRGHAADESDMAYSLGMPIGDYLALMHGKRVANDDEKLRICTVLKLTPETITTAAKPDQLLSKDVEFSFVSRMWVKSTLIHATRVAFSEVHKQELSTFIMRNVVERDLEILGLTKNEIVDIVSVYSEENEFILRVDSKIYTRSIMIHINIDRYMNLLMEKGIRDDIVTALVFRLLYQGYSTLLTESRLGESLDQDVCLIEAYRLRTNIS